MHWWKRFLFCITSSYVFPSDGTFCSSLIPFFFFPSNAYTTRLFLSCFLILLSCDTVLMVFFFFILLKIITISQFCHLYLYILEGKKPTYGAVSPTSTFSEYSCRSACPPNAPLLQSNRKSQLHLKLLSFLREKPSLNSLKII